MKNRLFATLSSLSLLTAAAAFAQSGTAMYADIPFEFRVGATVLPPGHYEVHPQNTPGLVLIRCLECKAGMLFITEAVDARKTPENGTLVFHRYENTLFLSKIWTPGDSRGRELRITKSEREYARVNLTNPPVAVALAPR